VIVSRISLARAPCVVVVHLEEEPARAVSGRSLPGAGIGAGLHFDAVVVGACYVVVGVPLLVHPHKESVHWRGAQTFNQTAGNFCSAYGQLHFQTFPPSKIMSAFGCDAEARNARCLRPLRCQLAG
jgi:hypothetical protein